MEWKPYGPCCQRYAGDEEAAFCPECGHAYMRCMAFSECRSLVSPGQACPVCVAPELIMEAGAVVQSRTGERVAVPFVLHNRSPNRPLWVKQIFRLDGPASEAVPITWEQVEPGTERRFDVEVPPIAEGGQHVLRLLLLVSSRNRSLEETYAYTGATTLTVEAAEAQQVIQNINLTGAQFQTGGMVHTTLNTKDRQASTATATRDRSSLPLERAERYELANGFRGYASGSSGEGFRVFRSADVLASGFSADDIPPDGASLSASGKMSCGRNSRVPNPSINAAPMDLSLRVYQRDGQVNSQATLALSRHHFDLVNLNDRLYLHVRSSNGVELNGALQASGALAVLASGDRVVPIPGRPDLLTLTFGFASAIGSVNRITINRIPAVAT